MVNGRLSINMNTNEQALQDRETGELIREIIENGFTVDVGKVWMIPKEERTGNPLEVITDPLTGEESTKLKHSPFFRVTCQSGELRDTPAKNHVFTRDVSMNVALHKCANRVRQIIGKPSIEMELAKMIQADAAIDEKSVFRFGDNMAGCPHCGSHARPRFDVKAHVTLSWIHGGIVDRSIQAVEAGSIGHCVDCGNHIVLR